jgi:hypothetical protein
MGSLTANLAALHRLRAEGAGRGAADVEAAA